MFKYILLIFTVVYYFKVSLGQREGFIVGGTYAQIKDFPYAASLSIHCNKRGSICGGSIVNQWIILTAAHCLVTCNKKTDSIDVSIGSGNKKEGVMHTVSDFAIHEDYSSAYDNRKRADIALAKVENAIRFGPTVKRVILMKNPPSARIGLVAGWGLTDEVNKVHTRDLKMASQTIWTRSKCLTKLDKNKLPTDAICGGDLYASDYAAKGDSGSALVIRGTIQVGIVSFKYMTPAKISLTVYTDVSKYYDWIRRTAMDLSCRNDW